MYLFGKYGAMKMYFLLSDFLVVFLQFVHQRNLDIKLSQPSKYKMLFLNTDVIY